MAATEKPSRREAECAKKSLWSQFYDLSFSAMRKFALFFALV
jgi:hypothetical protein